MKLWDRDQTIVALNLYCKIPFNLVSSRHPEIVRIATILDRSPNSVKMKIGNFGSFDEDLKHQGIVGLVNTSKLDREVWDEFNNNWEELAYESEILVAKFLGKSPDTLDTADVKELPEGRERESLVKTRVNQSFFRSTVLASYHSKCCITGLDIPELLVASHIIPWSKSPQHRMDPRNGLCLNSLHDKAFDKGLFTITTDYRIKISNRLGEAKSDDLSKKLFHEINGRTITKPDKFVPSPEFLEYHNHEVFIG